MTCVMNVEGSENITRGGGDLADHSRKALDWVGVYYSLGSPNIAEWLIQMQQHLATTQIFENASKWGP